MKKLVISLVVAMFLFTGMAWGAGSSCTETTPYKSNNNGVVKILVACVGDDSAGTWPTESVDINGWIMKVETDPGATAPDTNWGVTLISAAGVDVMGGETDNNRSATVSEAARPKLDSTFGDDYIDTVTVTAADNTAVDAIISIYIWVSTSVPVKFY